MPSQTNPTHEKPKIFLKIGGSVWGPAMDGHPPDSVEVMADQIAQLSQLHNVVVIVSAFKGRTDQLMAEAQIRWPQGEQSSFRERSARAHFIAQGENEAQIALTAALQRRDINAAGFTGQEVFSTYGNIENAEIKFFQSGSVVYQFLQPYSSRSPTVAVVAGFSGYDEDNQRHTIFGRGGSDRSLMGLLISGNVLSYNVLNSAIPGQIVRHEGGVLTADPKIVPHAIQHKTLTTGELLAMTFAGGGRSLIQYEAAQLAHFEELPLRIGRLNDSDGMTCIKPGPAKPEKRVLAIAYNDSGTTVSIIGWNIASEQDHSLDIVAQATAATRESLSSRISIIAHNTPQIATIALSDRALIKPAVQALHAHFRP